MKLVLPPRLSPAQFDTGLAAFSGVVGKGWVMASDLDRDTYADIYAPGNEDQWPASAAVAPANVEELQAIVRLANEHKIPLWPISRGKNLGYGTAAPRMAGTVVLDLGRMNKILELDTKLAYCVIEPGVGFFDLYDHIQAEKADLWMSVPGNAWGSVMGNALEHGLGYTPYGNHVRNICGMEVVLPNGEMVRTGMGAMTGGHAFHLSQMGYGPTWDQMFTQSNLGIVSKMGLWLQPAPASSLSLTMDIPNEEDIGWVVDTLAPLKINGTIDQNIFIPSWLGKMVLLGQRKDFWDKPSAMPESHVKDLLKQHQFGYWTSSVRLYGDKRLNQARAAIIKEAFAKQTDAKFVEVEWNRGDPVPAMDPTMGVPSAVALQMGNWVGGRGAHMGFSPIVPATSDHVLGQLKRSRAIMAKYDFDFYASFTINGRSANNINMLLYNRDDDKQVDNVRAMFNELIAVTQKAGYGEYRTHLGWMDKIAETFDFNQGAMAKLNQRIKDALDPNGIIAPGKQGVWPSTYADQARQGRVG